MEEFYESCQLGFPGFGFGNGFVLKYIQTSYFSLFTHCEKFFFFKISLLLEGENALRLFEKEKKVGSVGQVFENKKFKKAG